MKKTVNKSSTFGEEYYKTRNYVDYLDRSERYKHVAHEIEDLLVKLSLLDKNSCIVDFGCALGFLMEGFMEHGYSKICGVEVSDWAIHEGKKRGNDIIGFDHMLSLPWRCDVAIALDVLEHMDDISIQNTINKLNPGAMVVRIPNSSDGGKTFHLKVSQRDPTHINCKTKKQWINFFHELGYRGLRLNTYSIYDSVGVTCLLLIKENVDDK